ncbi:MAG: 4Fe-4S dicluster domain-containing protein [Chloroflexota bacterium]|nr:MAG: 4Fe-4S dicluster domain-containing protein [Chloroflexota bacterium]
MISLTIEGRPVQVPEGSTVLDAARKAGVYVPTLCHDPDLKPYGACRLCLVEVEGVKGYPASCTLPANNGMVVRTDTQALNQLRRGIVELLVAEGHDNCMACAKNNRCELQRIGAYVGLTKVRYEQVHRGIPVDDSNPFFYRDLDKCILCARCVRACAEVEFVNAIDYGGRGYDAVIATMGNRPLTQSNCESCGECVDQCPVGALVRKKNVMPTREVRTTCAYCGVGCGLVLGLRGDEIVQVRGDDDAPVNHGTLCVKGRFGVEFVHHKDRLRTPLMKKDGQFVPISWDEALDIISERLARYSGSEYASVASGRCTNEDNYVFQKFTRGVMGSNSIDHCARL